MMADDSFDMVILDELNIALRYGYIDVAEILSVLSPRREMLHVVVTGRNAREELIEAADLVTEMTQVKHPFRSGVKAQAGSSFETFRKPASTVLPDRFLGVRSWRLLKSRRAEAENGGRHR